MTKSKYGLLSAIEAASRLRVTITEFHKLVKDGVISAPINLGKRFWEEEEIDALRTAYDFEQEKGRK